MDKKKEMEIYAKILYNEGPELQLKRARYKCNGLNFAITDYINDTVSEKNMENLREAIADVYITLGQLSRWIGEDVVMYEVNHKLYNMLEELKSGN